MARDDVLVERNGAVTTVIINRPEARNACRVETVKALHDAFMAFEADDGARVAVLAGQGGSFCAGADLKELASGAALGFCWAGDDKGLTRRLLKKPVIAAVEGHAVPAGLASRCGAISGSPTRRRCSACSAGAMAARCRTAARCGCRA
jgi:enoyl-CoA hydratase